MSKRIPVDRVLSEQGVASLPQARLARVCFGRGAVVPLPTIGASTVHRKEDAVDVKWVQIRSWHAVKAQDEPEGWATTYCGRAVAGLAVDALPAGRSCESCLRSIARKMDH